MAFPQSPLDVRTELQLGGVWTDITSDTYLRSPISITRGRADEGARVDPGKCSLVLNNRSGKFTPRNPVGPYYGLIGRNTPLRVSVMAGATYLDLPGSAGARVSTPDASPLDVTGDIDIRLELLGHAPWQDSSSLDLLSKYDNVTGSNQRSYRLETQGGAPVFSWSVDGTAATFQFAAPTVFPAVPASGRIAIRVTLDVDNGAGGWTVRWYTAATIAGPWTQLGADVTGAGVTSIFNSNVPLVIGDSLVATGGAVTARVLAAEVRAGIGGTVVANPDFTVQAPGATSFTDGAGRTWTVSAPAALTNRRTRFCGEISAWPPRWDVDGKDVWTSVEAAGIKRRLGQGETPLASTLRRRIPSASPLAYWPCEDERLAVQAASPTAGVLPLAVTGWSFAADDTLPGSRSLPTIDAAASMSASIPPGTPGTWQLRQVHRIDTAPAAGSDQTYLRFTSTGTVVQWRIGIDVGSIRTLGLNAAGTAVVNTALAVPQFFGGGWTQFAFALTAASGTVTWEIDVIPIGRDTGVGWSGTYSGTVGTLAGINTDFGAGLSGMGIGHISAFSTPNDIYTHADNGFAGEYASERIPRLCTEEGVALSSTSWDRGVRLGSQLPNTLLALLEEASEADQGVLYEQRDAIALRYRYGFLTYNQPVALALDYALDGDVAPPLEPTDDDQAARNDITITRTGGSSAHAVAETGTMSVLPPPAGIGRVTDSATLNLWLDSQAADHAAWRLHLGTTDAARYPTVHVDLAAAPRLITACTEVDVRDRITIAHPPAWLPPDPIDLIAEGYHEVIGQYAWDIVYNCTPGSPWLVAALDDPVLGRADTAGSQLAAGATATATTLSVATTSGPLWTVTAGDFPFDVTIAGEQITVTNITGAASPQTFTVTRSVNGISKAQLAAADVRLTQPMILAL